MINNLDSLLNELRRLDIKLAVQNGRLRVDAPAGVLTASLRQQLVAHKPALLTLFQKSQRPTITAVPRDDYLPLSYAQQRLWVLAQFPGATVAYNMPTTWRITGSLDLLAFERAINTLVARHEVFRTQFILRDGTPYQEILPSLSLPVCVTDLSHLSTEEQSAEVTQQVATFAKAPFDLTTAPLLRVALLWLGSDEHILLLNMHHIISDAWSNSILVRELSTLYTAYCQDAPNPLPPLPIQYADFAQWQRNYLQGAVLTAQLDYWRQQLNGAPALLELPTDRPRPSVQTHRGSFVRVHLPVNLTQQLDRLSEQQGVTLYMLLLAGWSILLSRYSGQEDLVIGSPIANRSQVEIESLIGFFVNTLALRIDLSGNPTFLELLQQVKATTLGAYAHQDVPFEKLVQELDVERDLSYNPLFQVMLTWQNVPRESVALSDVTFKALKSEKQMAKFDMTLRLTQRADGIVGRWEYNSDLFDTSTIERMSGHFAMLLQRMVAQPETPVQQLPLLTERERQQLFVEWNSTTVPFPADKTVVHLFEEQTQRTSDATSVIYEKTRLTYRELNARANQLAHFLIDLGGSEEVRIASYLERSQKLPLVVLAIWKAGAIHVPLTPNLPAERTRSILTQAEVSYVLTEKDFAENLPLTAAQVLNYDKLPLDNYPETNPNRGIAPDQLAHIVFTSGSTGQPKGILTTHRGIVNYLTFLIETYQLGTKQMVLQLPPITFDASVRDIFGTITSGGQLVMVNQQTAQNPYKLLEKIGEHNVNSLLSVVPAMLRALIQAASDRASGCDSLRLILTSGEPLLPSDWQAARKTFGTDLELINQYGPSETTMTSTYYWLQEKAYGKNGIPIGRPIYNQQIYLLDEYKEPVPIGVVGELYIGGAGVGRGYLNLPELTAKSFIDNPFGAGKLYKTGDLARYLPDGNLEFLGRIDHQVKLRGFRIELGEIEVVLNRHPTVREAVVILREDEPNQKRLVAYIVASSPSSVRRQQSGQVPEFDHSNPTSWRTFLSDKLPHYMIPSIFVTLDAMPLSRNGKINRRSLPAPDATNLATSAAFVPPRDGLEYQLVHIWERVLGCPVGIHHDFFELGGDSLLAIKLMSYIQSELELPISIDVLMQNATIEQLANVLRKNDIAIKPASIIPFQLQGNGLPFFFVPGLGLGGTLYLRQFAQNMGTERPIYGLQPVALHGESAPLGTIEDMAAHHIHSIQSVQPEGPYFIGGHSYGSIVAYEMARQLHESGKKIKKLVIFDASVHFLKDRTQVKTTDSQLLARMARNLERSYEIKLDISEEVLNNLPPADRLPYFCKTLQRTDILPPDVDIMKKIQDSLAFMRASTVAKYRYRPQHIIPVPVLLFRAEQSKVVYNGREENRSWGWHALATEAVDVHFVPGDHRSMMVEPHVRTLAEILKKVLREAETRS